MESAVKDTCYFEEDETKNLRTRKCVRQMEDVKSELSREDLRISERKSRTSGGYPRFLKGNPKKESSEITKRKSGISEEEFKISNKVTRVEEPRVSKEETKISRKKPKIFEKSRKFLEVIKPLETIKPLKTMKPLKTFWSSKVKEKIDTDEETELDDTEPIEIKVDKTSDLLPDKNRFTQTKFYKHDKDDKNGKLDIRNPDIKKISKLPRELSRERKKYRER